MKHKINKFYESGQIHLIAIVENDKIISLRKFDTSGKEMNVDIRNFEIVRKEINEKNALYPKNRTTTQLPSQNEAMNQMINGMRPLNNYDNMGWR